MAEAEVLPFAGGHVAVYSARSPDKETANEDAAGLIPINDDSGVLVVADGMGGRPGGDSASRIAVRCFETHLEEHVREGGVIRAAVLDAVEHANRAVLDLGIGAATTLAAVEISAGTLRPYHVGDSAILVAGQRGKIKLQTVAHSPVGYALESGFLDEKQALHHNDRHLISNMVGAPDMRIEVGSHLRLASRDTVVVATDGLFDNLGVGEIVKVVRTKPLEAVSEQLAGECSRRMGEPRDGRPSKPDDCTFLIFRP
jgi:serine/threonine protein phosphatase PrpC